jgi:hypothetical protein
MKSIISYPNRGQGGNNLYRGNCSPKVVEDLLKQFQPKTFLEAFSGSGSGMYAARQLGYKDSIHLDLNPANSTYGSFNLLKDEIPCGSDFIFAHPPYHSIIEYSGVVWGEKPFKDDLSRCPSYEDFIKKLDLVNGKLFSSLRNGGHMAILIGDVRKNRKYYSIQKNMLWMGQMVSHVIKAQHNCYVTDNKQYRGSYIPIIHEHLLIFKKENVWAIPLQVTKSVMKDLRDTLLATWRDLVQATLESLGGHATLAQIYEVISSTKKAGNNPNWQAKIRQTLQLHKEFYSSSRGSWGLTNEIGLKTA